MDYIFFFIIIAVILFFVFKSKGTDSNKYKNGDIDLFESSDEQRFEVEFDNDNES